MSPSPAPGMRRLVVDIPAEVDRWIGEEKARTGESKRRIVLRALRQLQERTATANALTTFIQEEPDA